MGGKKEMKWWPREWDEYISTYRSSLEEVKHTIYDTRNFYSMATSRLVFFTEQSVGVSGADVTNMALSSMLPNPCSFLIEAIYIHGTSSDLGDGTFELIIGNKVYVDKVPAWTFGLRWGNLLSPQLMIAPLQHFSASITWNEKRTLRGFDGAELFKRSIQVCLRGRLLRPIC